MSKAPGLVWSPGAFCVGLRVSDTSHEVCPFVAVEDQRGLLRCLRVSHGVYVWCVGNFDAVTMCPAVGRTTEVFESPVFGVSGAHSSSPSIMWVIRFRESGVFRAALRRCSKTFRY